MPYQGLTFLLNDQEDQDPLSAVTASCIQSECWLPLLSADIRASGHKGAAPLSQPSGAQLGQFFAPQLS
jgi:hypothetical protein